MRVEPSYYDKDLKSHGRNGRRKLNHPSATIADIAKDRTEVGENAWRYRFKKVKSEFTLLFKRRKREYYRLDKLTEWADSFND